MPDPDPLATLDSFATAWHHGGAAADRVRALKYRRSTALVTGLADVLASRAPVVDLVTWCPASTRRRATRGFDQSELLARAVAHRLGVPARPLLRRLDRTAQTTRDRAGRLAGPQLRARGRRHDGARVLVVDDVATTGATLAAAATALRGRGAVEVHGLVVTRARREALATK